MTKVGTCTKAGLHTLNSCNSSHAALTVSTASATDENSSAASSQIVPLL